MKTSNAKFLVDTLKRHDARFQLYGNRENADEIILSHPGINGRLESYPLKTTGDSQEINSGHFSAIVRRFGLPEDFFEH